MSSSEIAARGDPPSDSTRVGRALPAGPRATGASRRRAVPDGGIRLDSGGSGA
jgi:hypothetical protein